MGKRFILLLPVLLQYACSAGVQFPVGENLFRALPGSEFIVHADIVIPPGQLRASFQGGERSNGASEFEPRCELTLRDFASTPQRIRAGSYRIVKVRGMDRYVNAPDQNLLLAAAGVLQHASDTDSEWYMRTYRMTLQAEMPGEAPTLVCGGAYNYAYHVRYPALVEMNAALGDYAQIRLR